MNCNEFKTWLSNKDISDAGVAEETKMHMEGCALCKKLYSMDSLIEAQIKEGLKKTDPPKRLFARIEMNLQSTKEDKASDHFTLTRFAGAWWKILAAPVAVAAVLFFVLYPFSKGFESLEEIGKLAVNDHLSNLAMTFNAGEISDIPGWFENRIGYGIRIPDLAKQGLTFSGGRKCHLGNRDAAYLLYEKEGKRASLFIIKTADLNFKMENTGRYHITQSGCDIQFWKNAKLLYAMVE